MSPKHTDEQTDDRSSLIAPPPKPGLYKSLRNAFLTGVVVAAPVSITAALVYMFVTQVVVKVDQWVRPLIPERFNPESYLPFSLPGLGVLVAIIGLIILGILARNLFGRAIIDFGERVVDGMPVIRTLYKFFKNIFETVLTQSEDTFQEVALVEYPRKGSWVIAFVTARTKGEVQAKTEGDVVSVFVPTTPNPTSGFLLFIDRAELKILDMTVEEAAKMVVSAGIVAPQYEPLPPHDDIAIEEVEEIEDSVVDDDLSHPKREPQFAGDDGPQPERKRFMASLRSKR